jgi:hypothetical protein
MSIQLAMSAKPKTRPPLHDSLNALLHTMRCIELHEPQLCSLLNELKTTNKMTPKLAADLRAVLDKLPARAYTDDLDAVEQALNG